MKPIDTVPPGSIWRWIKGDGGQRRRWRDRDLYESQDGDDYFPAAPFCVSLTAAERQRGVKWLEELGVARDAPLVGLQNRDTVVLAEQFPNVDWSYHNYPDTSVTKMIPATRHAAESGGYAIRTG